MKNNGTQQHNEVQAQNLYEHAPTQQHNEVQAQNLYEHAPKAKNITEQHNEVQAQNLYEHAPKAKNITDALKIADLKVNELEQSRINKNIEPSNSQKAVTEVIEPLKYWADEEKAFFNTLDIDGKKRMMGMFKNIQSVYDRKTQELKKLEKEYNNINDLLSEHDKYFEENNISKAQYINSLVEADRLITADPVGFIFNVMVQRGINFDTLVNGLKQQAQRATDPVYNRLAPLEIQNRQLKALHVKRAQQDLENELEKFVNAQDEKGNKKYPYFQEVEQDMAQLATQTGITDLTDLYEKAIWLNPKVREKVLREINNGSGALAGGNLGQQALAGGNLGQQALADGNLGQQALAGSNLGQQALADGNFITTPHPQGFTDNNSRQAITAQKAKKASSIGVTDSMAIGTERKYKKTLDDIIREEAQRLE
ncbi:MAG: hypothetical protein LBD46_07830 [Endomicrobium sp.]|nr:hypothetical protein [Endomicrobium sp.]